MGDSLKKRLRAVQRLAKGCQARGVDKEWPALAGLISYLAEDVPSIEVELLRTDLDALSRANEEIERRRKHEKVLETKLQNQLAQLHKQEAALGRLRAECTDLIRSRAEVANQLLDMQTDRDDFAQAYVESEQRLTMARMYARIWKALARRLREERHSDACVVSAAVDALTKARVL